MKTTQSTVSLAAVLLAIVAAGLTMHFSTARADEPKAGGAEIGKSAPGFALADPDGKTVSLGDFAGKIVVLEWTNPHCPFVLRHYQAKTMQNLYGQYQDKGVAWVAINSTRGTTNESDKQWAAEQKIPYPVLNDVQTDAGKAYHASNTPEMFIVGKDGTLLYKGAIDNDPSGDKTTGKVNYVQQALDEVLARHAVSTPETKPYGCGVKYRD